MDSRLHRYFCALRHPAARSDSHSTSGCFARRSRYFRFSPIGRGSATQSGGVAQTEAGLGDKPLRSVQSRPNVFKTGSDASWRRVLRRDHDPLLRASLQVVRGSRSDVAPSAWSKADMEVHDRVRLDRSSCDQLCSPENEPLLEWFCSPDGALGSGGDHWGAHGGGHEKRDCHPFDKVAPNSAAALGYVSFALMKRRQRWLDRDQCAGGARIRIARGTASISTGVGPKISPSP